MISRRRGAEDIVGVVDVVGVMVGVVGVVVGVVGVAATDTGLGSTTLDRAGMRDGGNCIPRR